MNNDNGTSTLIVPGGVPHGLDFHTGRSLISRGRAVAGAPNLGYHHPEPWHGQNADFHAFIRLSVAETWRGHG